MVANKRSAVWKGGAGSRHVDKSAELGGLVSFGNYRGDMWRRAAACRPGEAEVRKTWLEG